MSPTTAPTGAVLRVVTAEVPAPTKKLPDVNVATPVPPLATPIFVIVFEAPEITLLVRVSDVPVPTSVVVVFGRVSVLPPLTMDAITGAVSVLLVSVSAVARPTSVSVADGIVIVLAPLTIVEIAGVVRVGDVPNTSAPDPVSSLITPASCADVVAAN